jgi:hypothetical protein
MRNPAQEIGLVAAKNFLGDEHFVRVLVPTYLQQLPRQKGKPSRFKIVLPLPAPGEYKTIKEKFYTHSLADQVEGAYSTFEDLASQLRDWYDNLPESFQGADKGQQIEDAASTLENHSSAPDVPDFATHLPVYHADALLKNLKSRSDQNAEACSILSACVDAIDKALAAGQFVSLESKEPVVLTAEQKEELEQFRDEINSAFEEAEGVEFPGMY